MYLVVSGKKSLLLTLHFWTMMHVHIVANNYH